MEALSKHTCECRDYVLHLEAKAFITSPNHGAVLMQILAFHLFPTSEGICAGQIDTTTHPQPGAYCDCSPVVLMPRVSKLG